MKRISILGSTGSIGQQTLDVIAEIETEIDIFALTANSSLDLLFKQIKKFKPEYAVLMNEKKASELKYRLNDFPTTVLSGMDGLINVATAKEVDLVVNSVVGSVGVKPTYEAIKAKKDIALANKETLVTAGSVIMAEADKNDVNILPVDSEHNAIFQALQGEEIADVKRIILTASGGPFREYSKEELNEVTVEQALDHPNWDMGGKITIDSATLMNKGLEVIEAKWLFDLSYDEIDVVVHPQSIIHSLVEYKDHSVLAELGLPDMKVPIQYALTYPKRAKNNLEPLNLAEVGELTFEEPKRESFPCLNYAYQAGKAGGTMPAVLNAANEIAVSAFLDNQIKFITIPKVIAATMDKHKKIEQPELSDIFKADKWAREQAKKEVEINC